MTEKLKKVSGNNTMYLPVIIKLFREKKIVGKYRRILRWFYEWIIGEIQHARNVNLYFWRKAVLISQAVIILKWLIFTWIR